MLSILIPVFNYNVLPLVESLIEQGLRASVEFEIIVHDDASAEAQKAINKPLNRLEKVSYKEHPENLGRAKIRNRLAEDAKFPYILFLDCDSSLPGTEFLQRYLNILNHGIVACGGTGYRSAPPMIKDHFLRWHYGTHREMKSSKERNDRPNFAITTNNLLIDKELFLTVKFDESLTRYGHEDTLFGLAIKEKGHVITHIDNPLIHEGLESAEVFLEKTEQGVMNLKMLIHKQPQYMGLFEEVKLVKWYSWIKKIGLQPVFALKFRIIKPILRWNLTGKNPSLKLFDLYKLGLLCRL
ncbi:MAG: glycosyltransferase involved in cell wall biosynthesis [Sphingobacteriales bacterium]|jgi:glycosyltransferase involved in cell wall biosynthesis